MLDDLGDTAWLSGPGDLSVRRRSAVRGFKLAAGIREAKAGLKGQSLAADSSPDRTDFCALTGTAAVGEVVNSKLAQKKESIRQKLQDRLKNKLKGLLH